MPPSQAQHCVVGSCQAAVERLCLPTLRTKGQGSNSYPLSPVFSVSVGRDSSALLDLSHTLSDHLHVVVTVQSDLVEYVRAWPRHLIMALPDREASGRGEGGGEGGGRGGGVGVGWVVYVDVGGKLL